MHLLALRLRTLLHLRTFWLCATLNLLLTLRLSSFHLSRLGASPFTLRTFLPLLFLTLCIFLLTRSVVFHVPALVSFLPAALQFLLPLLLCLTALADLLPLKPFTLLALYRFTARPVIVLQCLSL
jgi:hypothetical protein